LLWHPRGLTRKRSDFHDTYHCPECNAEFPNDLDEAEWLNEQGQIVCRNGHVVDPDDVVVVTGEDHYQTWGDEQYHRLKEDGLI